MALLRELFSRQLTLSHTPQIPLRWLWEDLCCHYQDEVFLRGGLTGMSVPPFVCKFSPDGLHGNLLAVADEEGSVRLMDTRPRVSQSLVKEIIAHSNAIFDVAWLPGGTKLVTASGDTSVRLWDAMDGTLLTTFKAHTGSVKTVDVKTEEPSVFVSAGRDGNIMIWDTRCSTKGAKHRPVNIVPLAHRKPGSHPISSTPTPKRRRGRTNSVQKTPSDTQHSVTAVLFHGDNKVASAGAADGTVKLWDLRRTYTNCRSGPPQAWQEFTSTGDSQRPFGFTSLVSDPFQSCLFASCTDDIIYKYHTSGLQKNPVGAFSGHQNSTFYVKAAVSPDGRYLLSGSSCSSAFIWEVDHPERPPLVLSGHVKEVTAVSWCPSQMDKIVTCSDNHDIRIWRVVRNRKSSFPGEFIGTCESYTGEGHEKAADVLKRYRRNHGTETSECAPLRPVHNLPSPSSNSGKQKSSNVASPKENSPLSSSVQLKLNCRKSANVSENGTTFCTPKPVQSDSSTLVPVSSPFHSPLTPPSAPAKLNYGKDIPKLNLEEDSGIDDAELSQTNMEITPTHSSRHADQALHQEQASKLPPHAKKLLENQRLSLQDSRCNTDQTELGLLPSATALFPSPCKKEMTPERDPATGIHTRKRKLGSSEQDKGDAKVSKRKESEPVKKRRKQTRRKSSVSHKENQPNLSAGRKHGAREKELQNGAGHHKADLKSECRGKSNFLGTRGLHSYFSVLAPSNTSHQLK